MGYTVYSVGYMVCGKYYMVSGKNPYLTEPEFLIRFLRYVKESNLDYHNMDI